MAGEGATDSVEGDGDAAIGGSEGWPALQVGGQVGE